MRNKDVKQLIQKAALYDMPDVRAKINLNVIPDVIDEPILHTHNPIFTWTRVLKFASLLLLVSLTSVFIYQQITRPLVEIQAMETEAELIGFPAISGSTLLFESSIAHLNYDDLIPLSDSETLEIEPYLNQFNSYLNAMETLIGDKSSLNYSLEENGEDYQYQIVYQSTDLLNNAVEYRLLYNKTKLDEPDTYSLEGVIVLGDQEIHLQGRLVQRHAFTRAQWTLTIDSTTSLVVEDMTTEDKQLFRYQVYENDLLKETAILQLRLENNAVKGQLSIEDNETEIIYQMARYKQNSDNGFQVAYALKRGPIVEDGDMIISASENTTGQSEYHIVITPRGQQANVTIVDVERKNKKAQDSDSGNNDTPGNSNNNPRGHATVYR